MFLPVHVYRSLWRCAQGSVRSYRPTLRVASYRPTRSTTRAFVSAFISEAHLDGFGTQSLRRIAGSRSKQYLPVDWHRVRLM